MQNKRLSTETHCCPGICVIDLQSPFTTTCVQKRIGTPQPPPAFALLCPFDDILYLSGTGAVAGSPLRGHKCENALCQLLGERLCFSLGFAVTWAIEVRCERDKQGVLCLVGSACTRQRDRLRSL